jgi:hypothetical protein
MVPMDCIEDILLVVEQLELSEDLISRSDISSGSALSNTRSALILIDNVIEIIIYRYLRFELKLNGQRNAMMRDPLVRKFDPNYKNYKDELEETELEKGKKLWGFTQRVDYLVRKKRLDGVRGEIIKYAHDHRNIAYHKEEFFYDVTYPLTMLLFRIACDLIINLREPHLEISINPNQLNISFLTRYDLKDKEIFIGEDLRKISDRLKEHVLINLPNMKKFLMHLFASRLSYIKKARTKVIYDFNKNKRRVLSSKLKHYFNDKTVVYVLQSEWEATYKRSIIKYKTLDKQTEEVKLLHEFLKIEKDIRNFEINSYEGLNNLKGALSLAKELTYPTPR